jgi:hypothetical protein
VCRVPALCRPGGVVAGCRASGRGWLRFPPVAPGWSPRWLRGGCASG